ncbi:hypothetical protein RUM43_005330 [Polyplax serrata]|uniref:Uncharacterized protein n=1 Tax=Polyplax serrata TaxID=468196 RepID=A0AAN8NWJ1_POLSC
MKLQKSSAQKNSMCLRNNASKINKKELIRDKEERQVTADARCRKNDNIAKQWRSGREKIVKENPMLRHQNQMSGINNRKDENNLEIRRKRKIGRKVMSEEIRGDGWK